MKLLIVDDSYADRTMLTKAAEKVFCDATIYQADGFNEAVEIVDRSGPFDIVMTDVLLGFEGDGFELCKYIKSIHPLTVVFACTGSFTGCDHAAMRRAGGDGLMRKGPLLSYYEHSLAELVHSNGWST